MDTDILSLYGAPTTPEPVKEGGARREDMPDWWPEDRPPQKLSDTMIYRDRDGKWRHHDGVIVNRAERRRAKVK